MERKPDFSIIEIRLIQSMWKHKPPEHIAFVLDRPLSSVVKKIEEMNKVQNIKLYQRPGYERRLRKKTEEQDWAKRQIEEKKIKIKDFNKEQLITVRIDNRTTAQVKPGTDIEALKKKLLQNRILK